MFIFMAIFLFCTFLYFCIFCIFCILYTSYISVRFHHSAVRLLSLQVEEYQGGDPAKTFVKTSAKTFVKTAANALVQTFVKTYIRKDLRAECEELCVYWKTTKTFAKTCVKMRGAWGTLGVREPKIMFGIAALVHKHKTIKR